MDTISYQCPHPHPWHLGCMVTLDKFNVYVERFLLESDQKPGESTARIYLHFDMRNVRCVYKVKCSGMRLNNTLSIPSTAQCSMNKVPGPRSNTSRDADCTCMCCMTQLMYVLYKDTPQIRSRVNDKPRLTFYSTVLFLGDTQAVPCIHCSSKSNSSSNSNDAVRSSYATYSELLSHNKKLPPEAKTLCHKYVTVCFQGENVRWHPFLRPARSYRLVIHNSKDIKVFSSVFGYEKLRRVVEKSRTQQFITLPKGVEVIGVGSVRQGGNDCRLLGNVGLLSQLKQIDHKVTYALVFLGNECTRQFV